MFAISPKGFLIIGTYDTIGAKSLVHPDSFILDPTGALVIEWIGETVVCYDEQRTKTTEPLASAAPALLAALKEAIAALRFGTTDEATIKSVIGEGEAAILEASQLPQDLWIDEDGDEWPEDQLILLPDEEAVEKWRADNLAQVT